MAAWSQLPDDVLGLILEKLPLADYIRIGSVCTSWNSVVRSKHYRPKPQAPWLMLPGDDNFSAKFFSLSDNKTYRIPLPPPMIRRRLCVGSSFGWLITADEALEMHLLNPITGVQIQLPSATTLSCVEVIRDPSGGIKKFVLVLDGDGKKQQHRSKFTSYRMRIYLFEKAILTSAPLSDGSGDYKVILVHNPVCRLAVARAGDAAWTPVESSVIFADMIRHDRRIHTVGRRGTVQIWVNMDAHSPPSFWRKTIAGDCGGSGLKYLVESLTGELFLVERFQTVPSDDRKGMVTACFKVFVRDKQLRKWNRVTDMKDNVIFIGNNSSMALSGDEFPELRRNCIYFTDDLLMLSSLDPHYSRDMGVYDFGKNRIEPIGSLGPHLNWPPPIWITPSLL